MPERPEIEIIGDAADPAPHQAARPPLQHRLAGRIERAVPRSRAVIALAAALTVALVISGVLAGALWTHVRTTPAQADAVDVATAWVAAVDRHDVAAIRRTTVTGARVVVVHDGTFVDRAFRGRTLLLGDRVAYSSTLRLSLVGEPRALRDDQVAMTTSLVCDGATYHHVTVVNLAFEDGALKVTSAVLTTAPDAGPAPAAGGDGT